MYLVSSYSYRKIFNNSHKYINRLKCKTEATKILLNDTTCPHKVNFNSKSQAKQARWVSQNVLHQQVWNSNCLQTSINTIFYRFNLLFLTNSRFITMICYFFSMENCMEMGTCSAQQKKTWAPLNFFSYISNFKLDNKNFFAPNSNSFHIG